MDSIRSVGTFCINKHCPSFGQVEDAKIIRYGRSKQGHQRYRCKVCSKVFNDN